MLAEQKGVVGKGQRGVMSLFENTVLYNYTVPSLRECLQTSSDKRTIFQEELNRKNFQKKNCPAGS